MSSWLIQTPFSHDLDSHLSYSFVVLLSHGLSLFWLHDVCSCQSLVKHWCDSCWWYVRRQTPLCHDLDSRLYDSFVVLLLQWLSLFWQHDVCSCQSLVKQDPTQIPPAALFCSVRTKLNDQDTDPNISTGLRAIPLQFQHIVLRLPFSYVAKSGKNQTRLAY